jgi:SHS2 domain-containing protein
MAAQVRKTSVYDQPSNRFEIIEHTADVGLRIFGKDLSALFASAAEALMAVVVEDLERLRPTETEPVELEADCLEDLLVEWLGELLFRFDARHQIHAWPDVAVARDATLVGVSRYLPVNWQQHRFAAEVKAVTYHGASVEPTPEGWRAEVILDL